MSATSSYAGSSAIAIPTGILTQPAWSTLQITPTLVSDMGDYLITVTITDTVASISGTFMISVINTPPYFVSTVPSDFTMKFNNTYVYYLPKYTDNEGHTVTVIIESNPGGQVSGFSTIVDNSFIEFTPNDWS